MTAKDSTKEFGKRDDESALLPTCNGKYRTPCICKSLRHV